MVTLGKVTGINSSDSSSRGGINSFPMRVVKKMVKIKIKPLIRRVLNLYFKVNFKTGS